MSNITIATHNGSFHADDVFAVATVLLVYPGATIIRTRDEEKIREATIAVDVGTEYDPSRCRFDHHQIGGAGLRANTIPYASFGLVWKEFGEKLAGNREVAQIIDQKLVMPIDALDNVVAVSNPIFEGVRTYSVSDFFYSFIEEPISDDSYLFAIFMRAVDLAQSLLLREIKRAQHEINDANELRKILEMSSDRRLIVLDREMSWHRVLIPVPEALYVVYPRYGDRWGIEAVRRHFNGFELKKPLPETWAGKENQDLSSLTGVEDALFCHNKRFLAVAQTREGALRLAEIALSA
ncbi:MAG: metal-dependent protein hydrolase [Parcubacteria group bacterium]|nr:metal-dependent protein hydrolase [Parcubacteria group bacterium]